MAVSKRRGRAASGGEEAKGEVDALDGLLHRPAGGECI